VLFVSFLPRVDVLTWKISLQQAKKLCAEVITIPYEFERYKQLSILFYTVLMSHADDLQAVSVDEALIDVSTAVNELRERAQHTGYSGDAAKDFAEMIRDEVRKATTCESKFNFMPKGPSLLISPLSQYRRCKQHPSRKACYKAC
jgi:hypothetical protein